MADEWSASELFDEDYLNFYLPHLSDEASEAEAETIRSLLSLTPSMDVLDLACGHGRISNRLAATGARVTGIDATPLFLDMARREATTRNLEVDYVEGDMRALPWEDSFDAVVSWFTAFGYFDDAQNKVVLREAHKVLRRGGRLLIELNHKDGLLRGWLPSTVVRLDDSVMIDERQFDPLTGRSNATRTIIHEGVVRRVFYFTRLFSYTELRDWLLEVGFRSVEGFAGDGGPLTADARRMIMLATK